MLGRERHRGQDATKDDPTDASAQRHDLRLVPVALAVWAGTLAGLTASWPIAIGAVLFGVVVVPTLLIAIDRSGIDTSALGRYDRAHDESARRRRAGVVVVVAVMAGAAVGFARAVPVQEGPVAQLTAQRAWVEVEGVISEDPRPLPTSPDMPAEDTATGDSSEPVMVAMTVERVTGRGQTHAVSTAVFVTASDSAWSELRPGQPVATSGRLTGSGSGAVAAFLRADGPPEVRGPPSMASRATEPFRHGLREAVADLTPGARGLVPGLVIGDESLLPEQLKEDMQTTSLTHLTAVSGTNVTIVLVVALGLARWCGVRGRVLPVLGLLAIIGFVLLARPEPSVIRAAAMGTIAVVGITVAGRRRGLPALATAVIVLVLVDPWLARSPGFAMSVLATGGILVLVPRWHRTMSWLPSWSAVALAVPIAAQIVVTPVLVALSGEISLVSVPANLLAAPLVAPATIGGVAAAVVAPWWMGLAEVLAWCAGWPAAGIAAIATWGADLPTPTVPWPSGAVGVAAATAGAVVAVAVVPRVLSRPVVAVPVAAALVAMIVVAPAPGWPPPGWIVVACDVGQGDGLALRVDDDSAVVIDAGADAAAMRQCLDSLGVTDVPMLVLTHFDSDHVLGTPGVLDGRTVDRAVVSPLAAPESNATDVLRWLSDNDVTVEAASVGSEYVVGADVHLSIVWPRRIVSAGESVSNNASVVVLAEVRGVQILLTGDMEPHAQAAFLGAEPDLDVDVLKVPHHGSSYQDQRLLTDVGADIALIGVGADNVYGHPASWVVDALRSSGQRVVRTDRDGTTAVIELRAGVLGIVRRGRYRAGSCSGCRPDLSC